MKKVTGIGGIFFACKDPDKVKSWYRDNLGLDTDAYGTNFEWRQSDHPEKKGFTQWSTMSENNGMMKDSSRDFMINYRVENLDELIKSLKSGGVEVLDEIEETEYGNFVHILDPEGMKIQLWEPNDEYYDQIVEGRTK